MRHRYTSKYQFGQQVMGPIVAEFCMRLHDHLDGYSSDKNVAILFCARGGLMIRRMLALYEQNIEGETSLRGQDFMVSRLAASRMAFIRSPQQIAPLLAIEFEGRSNADVAKVLSGDRATLSPRWNQPYCIDQFILLLRTSPEGRRIHSLILNQADFLSDHLTTLCRAARNVIIVDTGVYGSIGHYLSIGFPDIRFQSCLLFHANYKGKLHLPEMDIHSLICNQNTYKPWDVRSVSRLYWPFIEAFFEPDLPSVRNYQKSDRSQLRSDLQIKEWRLRLEPDPESIQAGAYDYVKELTTKTATHVTRRSTESWKTLQRIIVFPTPHDVELLTVKPRGLDFGFDDKISLGEYTKVVSLPKKIAQINNSIWPESEIVRLFPITSSVWLYLLESKRWCMEAARVLTTTYKKFTFKRV